MPQGVTHVCFLGCTFPTSHPLTAALSQHRAPGHARAPCQCTASAESRRTGRKRGRAGGEKGRWRKRRIKTFLPLPPLTNAVARPAALTLIIALEVMRKSVARSFTALIFSPLSAGSFRFSSSLSERCRAAPCFAIRSLQVLRSSSLLERVFNVPCSSLLSDCEAGSSSPESSAKGGMEKKKNSFHGYSRTVLTRYHRGQGDLLPPPMCRQLCWGWGSRPPHPPGSGARCGGAMRDVTQSPEAVSEGFLWL